MATRNACICLAILVATSACGGGDPVSLTFAAQIGNDPFVCGNTYPGVGTTATELTVSDFRFYIHDVRLVTMDGTEVPVSLDDDGAWQNGRVALLDFEDATSTCEGGTSAMNSVVKGKVDVPGPYSGVRFELGVPFDLNHADATLAGSPLNLTSMFWGWQGGYKFLRTEGTSTGLPDGWRIHLGSTGCDGDLSGGVTMCTYPNVASIAVDGPDPTASVIAADLAGLLEESDMDANTPDTPPGCMATATDPDCVPVFAGLGLPFAGGPAEAQRFFRME